MMGILPTAWKLRLILLVAVLFSPLEAATLEKSEVAALRVIGSRLGKTNWDFSVDPCSGQNGWTTSDPNPLIKNEVACDCSFSNNTICHVVSIDLKGQNLSGVLPPEAARLHYLRSIDLTRNYLNGSIPPQWATMPLESISLVGNRLSGPIPRELGSITTLRNLTLEVNSFSGAVPPELGNLINLEILSLTSNRLTGELPEALSKLTNLTELRLSDNLFSGNLPNFIWRYTQLKRLDLQGCSFQGPIPSEISSLENLIDLRITDLNGPESEFPLLSGMQSLRKLILRNCSIHGSIPEYLGSLISLKTLDLSFNKLTGRIPISFKGSSELDQLYLTRNMLTGPVPNWIQKSDAYADLSYNKFSQEKSMPSTCQQGKINLVSGYSSAASGSSGIAQCLDDPRFSSMKTPYRSSLYINCGGEALAVGNNNYEADQDPASPSSFILSQYWAFSNTGDFMDDNGIGNYIITDGTDDSSPNLYKTARTSPLSLIYYGLFLDNGDYTVNLHFAEIAFTNDSTFSSLGRRIFDVYVQGSLVLKDFNIEDEAGGPGKPIVKSFDASVQEHTMEIHFYWAGKGTQSIPTRGVYGPLISAISVEKGSAHKKKLSTMSVVAIVVVAVVLSISLVVFILWRKGRFGRNYRGAYSNRI